MSLLMDALKRAETSKQAVARNLTGGDQSASQVPNLSLEPMPGRPSNASRPLPDLAQHIDSLNDDLATGAPASRPAAPQSAQPAPKEDENRAAIRNAFAAKEINPPSRKPLWLTMGGLALAAVAISAYVWYQMQSMNQGSMSAPRQVISNAAPGNATPSAPLPPPQYAPVSPPAVPIFSPNTPSTVTNATAAAAPALSGNVPPRLSAALREETASTSIRVTRSQPEPDANLQRGYANLQDNSLDQARREYEQALRNDPNNVDALLGLAAIAHRQGRSGDAERYQQRALDADPRDASAQAAALSNSNDPLATESRLKTLLAAQPESAPLNFALGNLYARQNRWNEAQQFYFNAVAGDTDNPDYLFNLAVSLDQLRQPKLAGQHYRMALEAGDRRPAAFDRERVTRRLNQLTP
jgi:Tfp pilus assembly protein PilF